MADMPALSQSACRWTKRDLDLLGVEYQYDKFDTIGITNGISFAIPVSCLLSGRLNTCTYGAYH